MTGTLEDELAQAKARIKRLVAELERERKIFHVARILRLRKVEDELGYIEQMLKLPVDHLDELATIVEDTLNVKDSSYTRKAIPGVG